jgi:acylphosphatase
VIRNGKITPEDFTACKSLESNSGLAPQESQTNEAKGANRNSDTIQLRIKRRFGFMASPSRMKRHRVTKYYSGHVQGVGFRYTVKTLTLGFEVTGMVRNLEDGRVELVAEGAKEELEAFLEAVGQSEVGRFVKKEQVAWSEAGNEFRGFEISR